MTPRTPEEANAVPGPPAVPDGPDGEPRPPTGQDPGSTQGPAGPPGYTPPTQAEITRRKDMCAFIIQFVRAMSQTSYYPKGHPAAVAVTHTPYEHLQALRAVPEITFGLAGTDEAEEILLESGFDQTIPLEELHQGQTFLDLVRRLKNLCQRHRIVSLSIKSSIREAELERFVEIFVTRNISKDAETANTRFSDVLVAAEVVNVSVMHRSDVVVGRQLPWRVRVVISRLKKDLKMIPLFANASAEKMVDVKRMLVADIVRPLRRPELVKELLLNCDLVPGDGLDWTLDEVESATVGAMSLELGEWVAWAMARELIRLKGVKASAADQERIAHRNQSLHRGSSRIIEQLFDLKPKAANEILRFLFDNELVAFEDLSPDLQHEILVGQWTDAFEQDTDGQLEEFDELASRSRSSQTARYLDRVKVLGFVLLELIRRERFALSYRLVERLHSHRTNTEQADHQQALQTTLTSFRTVRYARTIVYGLDTVEVKDRPWVGKLIGLLGPVATPFTVTLMVDSRDDEVRRMCVHLLSKQPNAVRPLLKARLGDKTATMGITIEFLRMARAVEARDAAEEILDLLVHRSPEVRGEALDTLSDLHGDEVAPLILDSLQDRDEGVRRRAFIALGKLGCTDAPFIEFIVEALRLHQVEQREVPDDLQLSAIQAVQRLGNVEIDEYDTMEHLLGSMVEPTHGLALMRWLRGQHRAKSDTLRIAACNALARMGTPEAYPYLDKAIAGDVATVAYHAEQAAKEIERRFPDHEG